MTLKALLFLLWAGIEPHLPNAIAGGLGAAVAQAWEKGLSLKDRLIQWTVGLLIAVYLVPAIGHVLGWSDVVTRGASFVIATFAFKAVGHWREAAAAAGTDIFRSLPEIVRGWIRRPGVPPEK